MISKKITLIGDFSTGKTSLIRRFVDNQFSDKYLSTLGVKISKKLIEIDCDITIQGLIWDIEGGTKTKPLNSTYLRGAHGCIIVADITRSDTLSHISDYVEKLYNISKDIPYVIALNKSDKVLEKDAYILRMDVINSLDIPESKVFLSSAKTGLEVENIFLTLAKLMLN